MEILAPVPEQDRKQLQEQVQAFWQGYACPNEQRHTGHPLLEEPLLCCTLEIARQKEYAWANTQGAVAAYTLLCTQSRDIWTQLAQLRGLPPQEGLFHVAGTDARTRCSWLWSQLPVEYARQRIAEGNPDFEWPALWAACRNWLLERTDQCREQASDLCLHLAGTSLVSFHKEPARNYSPALYERLAPFWAQVLQYPGLAQDKADFWQNGGLAPWYALTLMHSAPQPQPGEPSPDALSEGVKLANRLLCITQQAQHVCTIHSSRKLIDAAHENVLRAGKFLESIPKDSPAKAKSTHCQRQLQWTDRILQAQKLSASMLPTMPPMYEAAKQASEAAPSRAPVRPRR